jgi:uncharacterized membrane protein
VATLTVANFSTAERAQKMANTVLAWQKQNLISVQDAGIVTWPQGAKRPQTRQVYSLAGAGSISGAFWGLLFALIFWAPLFEAAGREGALRAKFNECGIGDNFVKLIQETVTEGTSALFLLTTGAVWDQIMAAVQGQTFEVISTNLSKEQEAELRAAFGED